MRRGDVLPDAAGPVKLIEVSVGRNNGSVSFNIDGGPSPSQDTVLFTGTNNADDQFQVFGGGAAGSAHVLARLSTRAGNEIVSGNDY